MSEEDYYEPEIAPAGSIKINIKGDGYLIRVMKPSNSATLNELQLSLKRNRDMLQESYMAMHETCRDDIFERVERQRIDYSSPTQNALVARANIDLLIPLINVKGGVASYEGKLEGLPIDKHITKLRNKAVDNVNEEKSKNRTGGFFAIAIVLALATFILWLFF